MANQNIPAIQQKAGNVGIGTASPQTKLDVIGDTFVKGVIFSYAGSGGNQVGGITWDSTDDGILFLKSSNTTKVNINSNGVSYLNGGNVGIGTTSTTATLTVSKAASNYVFDIQNADETAFKLRTYNHGTVTAPGLAFTQGLYYSTQENAAIRFYRGGGTTGGFLTFTTSDGTERMRINSDGNVGIGTTSPTGFTSYTVLDVYNTNAMLMARSSGGVIGQVNAANTDALYIGTRSNHNVYLTANNSTAVTVLTNGSIGIGTTSPAVKLNIRGDEGQPGTSGTTQNGILRVHAGSTEGWGETLDMGMHVGTSGPASYAWLQATNTSNLAINYNLALNPNGGNVGVGTTSPSYKLDVIGTIRASGSNPGFRTDNTTDYTSLANYKSGNRIWQLDAVGTEFRVYHDASSAYQITISGSNGNVGIGTTSPGAKLDVNGDIYLSETGVIQGRGYPYDVTLGGGADASTAIVNAGSTSGQRARIKVAGGGATDPNTIILYTASSERMRITSGGNVGIGTTSPSYKLQVKSTGAGDIAQFTGDQGFDGANRVYITNDAYVYGRTNLVLTGRLDASNDGFSFGTNCRNSIVFNTNLGGAQGATGTAKYSIQLEGNSGTLYFQSSGSDAASRTGIAFTQDGNVGIGTTNPVTRLQVVQTSNSATTYPLIINNQNNQAGDGFGAGIKFSTANPSDGGNEANKYSSIEAFDVNNYGSNSGLSFTVSDAYTKIKAMVINRSGGVGIGTTSPSYKLDVTGTGRFTSDLYGGGDIYTAASLRFNGSGLNASDKKLYSPADGELQWFTHTAAGAHAFSISHQGTRYIYLDISGNSYLNGGNVGIGTTSPSAKLDVRSQIQVKGDTNEQLVLDYTAASGNYTHQSFRVNGVNKYRIFGYVDGDFALYSDTGSAYVFYAKRDGNVGIGTTSPATKLQVNGTFASNALWTDGSSIAYWGSYSTAYGGLTWDAGYAQVFAAGGNALRLGANGTNTYMTINTSGNVGIGTTSPGYKLDVIGNIATDYTIHDSGTPFRLVKPRGGVYNNSTSTLTGAIRITYPVSFTNTMHHVKARVYEYSTNRSFTIHFGGYNYQPDSSWYNTFAYVEGDAGTDINPNVRFGYNGSRMVVYIGELASSWSYPQVFIDEVGLGFGGQSSAWATEAWAIGFEASAFASVTATISNTKAHVFARSGANAYYSTGNVGIGTTSPSSTLDVVGNIEYSGITKGSRGENKNFSSYDWCWHGKKYSGYIGDIRTKLYEYYYTTTALADEKYVNTYDADNDSRLSFDADSYTAVFTTHIHVKRQFTISNATLNGDDPYAIWVNGEYVSGADSCCTGVTYSYTFNVGWHRIDLIFSEGGGGDYVSMGWNPKNYTDYIDAMAPFGPLDFYSNQLTMRGGNVGIGTTNPLTKIEVYNSSEDRHFSAIGTSPSLNLYSSNTSPTYGGTMGLVTAANAYLQGSAVGDLCILTRGSYSSGIILFGSGSTINASLSTAGTLTARGDVVAYGSPSDITLKTNITPIQDALETVTKLQGVSFTWKEDTDVNRMVGIKDDIGFIAQEVQEVLPELVRKNDNGLLSLRDKGITALLVEAIKELKAQNDALLARIEQLENK